MISLLVAALAAAKAPPAPAPAPARAITTAEAAEYLRAIVPQIQATLAPIRSELAGLALDVTAKDAEARRVALVAAAKDAGLRLAGLTPFPDDDRMLVAAQTYATTVATECGGDLAAWVHLRDPVVADADLPEAVRLGGGAEGRLRAADDAFFAAVDAFGAAHGVRLSVARPAPHPEFVREGLPGDAPPRLTVQLAAAYHAQLVPMQTALEKTYAKWREDVVKWVPLNSPKLNPAATTHAASRETAGRAAAAIAKIGPWQGDAALRDAGGAMAKAVVAVLDGKGAEVTQKSMAGVQSQREVEALNAILKDADASVDAAEAAWEAAVAAFRERWGITAYEAWIASGPE